MIGLEVSMTLKIALVSRLDPDGPEADRIRAICGGAENVELLNFADDRDGLVERGSDVQIVYGNVREHEFDQLPNLKWVHATWSGVENLLYPKMVDSDVIVTNTRGQVATPMAEHGVGGMFYLARDLPAHVRGTMQRQWKVETEPCLVSGSQAIILGIGAIGRVLAPMLSALDVRVIGVNSDGRAVEGCRRTTTLDGVGDYLASTDWLFILLPATEQTHKIVDRDMLAGLKQGAGVINLSRGPVLDHVAMGELIEEGHLRGAVLDVTDPEPPDESWPLWEDPRILLTGHRSWKPPVESEKSRGFETFARNLEYFIQGEPERMLSLVDKKQGY
jgi:phosphoglycerate dehydrogenase-like enzyme